MEEQAMLSELARVCLLCVVGKWNLEGAFMGFRH